MNAFATPGGYLYVYSGLILAADNSAELAGVLGHEAGHVVARHSARQMVDAMGQFSQYCADLASDRRNCGQCDIGEARVLLERMGYKVFIVPGSSFIKRMVKKYRPKAIVGIGCLAEVKEGIDMADKLGLVVMGIVTLKEGCVETIANWPEIYEVAVLGIDPASVPEDLHAFTD